MGSSFCYGGFSGTAEYSKEDKCWHGRISGTEDIATYEAQSFGALREEFCLAVDDYIQTCGELG